MLVHIHFAGVDFRHILVTQLPPVPVTAMDPDAFPAGDGTGLLLFNGSPWKVLAFGIQLQDLAGVTVDVRLFFFKVSVVQDHQGRNGLEPKQITHLGGLAGIVRHDVNATDLGATGVKVVQVAVIADENHLALFRFQDGLGRHDVGGKFLAERTIVGSEKEGNVIVSLKKGADRLRFRWNSIRSVRKGLFDIDVLFDLVWSIQEDGIPEKFDSPV